MSHATKHLLVGVFISALACSSMWGQASTGQITGTVRDASGLAVPAAEVKATQTATGVSRDVTSGAQGDYTAANQGTPENLGAEGLLFPKNAGLMRDLLLDWFRKKKVIESVE